MSVTAVIVSRNDGYGGHLEERATYCLNSMINSFEEVIYVDWNSPTKETLIDVIKKDLILKGNLVSIRVPKEFHDSLNLSDGAQKCVEVLGRNIGIRRAKGDCIISTNVDIIAPRNIIYDPSGFYIAARRDIDLTSVEALGSSNDIQVVQDTLHRNIAAYGHAPIDVVMFKGDIYSKVDYCGDFQIASKELWYKIRGFEESFVFRGYADTHVQVKAYYAGYELVATTETSVFHIRHGGGLGGGVGRSNGMGEVRDITVSENKASWGFSNIDFEIERM